MMQNLAIGVIIVDDNDSQMVQVRTQPQGLRFRGGADAQARCKPERTPLIGCALNPDGAPHHLGELLGNS